MSKFMSTLVLIIVLGLDACGTVRGSAAQVLPSPAPATATSVIPTRARPPTVAPSATATISPTPVPSPGIPAFNNAAIKAQIDRLATWFLGQGKNSGLGVAVVVRNPQTGQLEAMLLNYGTSAKDNGQAVTSSTEYEIGSITKVFTGILLAEAVGSGAVQLDDPIQKYLPPGIQAPTYKDEPIRLVDLATHRSALPRDIDTDSLPELYGWLNTFQLGRAPGSEYAYSNVGYALLGDILARLSGSDYGTLEFQSLSQPLGLMGTREALSPDQTSRLAKGYTYDGSPAGYFPDSGAMSGAGYLRSTLDDLTRFLVANMDLDPTPLSLSMNLAEAVQAEGRNPGTGIGLGWEVDQLGTTNERLSKGGGTLGFTSYISFMRDGSSGFVLLTNGMYVDQLVPGMIHILSDN